MRHILMDREHFQYDISFGENNGKKRKSTGRGEVQEKENQRIRGSERPYLATWQSR